MKLPSVGMTTSSSTICKVIVVWALVSLLYSASNAYLTGVTVILFGVTMILAVVVIMARTTGGDIGTVLVWSLPLVGLSWLAFWTDTNNAHWDKVFVLPVLAGAVALIWAERGWHRQLSLAVIAGGMIGIAISGWRWGKADIDVFIIMQRGALTLLHGHNPYQAWFPSTTLGVHRFHYDYGPLLLVLSAPAAWLGDVRLLTLLAASGILALGMWRLRRTMNRLPLLLLLGISPWLLWPAIQSWTELVAMALVLGWYGLSQTWKWSWLLLAVAVAVNPIVLLLAVPILVLFPELRRTTLAGIAVGFFCYVPAYLLTGPDFTSAFQIASRQEYIGTVGFGGLFGVLTGRALPETVALVVFLGGCLLAHLRLPQSRGARELAVAGIAAATVLCLPVSFFEYVLIPMLWIWWWLGTATLAVGDEADALLAAATIGPGTRPDSTPIACAPVAARTLRRGPMRLPHCPASR
jgi:hypothetical protein